MTSSIDRMVTRALTLVAAEACGDSIQAGPCGGLGVTGPVPESGIQLDGGIRLRGVRYGRWSERAPPVHAPSANCAHDVHSHAHTRKEVSACTETFAP